MRAKTHFEKSTVGSICLKHISAHDASITTETPLKQGETLTFVLKTVTCVFDTKEHMHITWNNLNFLYCALESV
jgi:hypothetical protein